MMSLIFWERDMGLLIERFSPCQERGLHILRGLSKGNLLLEENGLDENILIFHPQQKCDVKGNPAVRVCDKYDRAMRGKPWP